METKSVIVYSHRCFPFLLVAHMNSISTGEGGFSEEEKTTHDHINKLKLHSVLLGSLAREVENTHIKIICDNSTIVACKTNLDQQIHTLVIF